METPGSKEKSAEATPSATREDDRAAAGSIVATADRGGVGGGNDDGHCDDKGDGDGAVSVDDSLVSDFGALSFDTQLRPQD